LTDVIEALKLALTMVEEDLKSCGATISEGKAYGKEVAESLTNSTKRSEGLHRLEENFVKVAENLEQAVKNFKNHSYTAAGMNFGEIMRIYVWGPEN